MEIFSELLCSSHKRRYLTITIDTRYFQMGIPTVVRSLVSITAFSIYLDSSRYNIGTDSPSIVQNYVNYGTLYSVIIIIVRFFSSFFLSRHVPLRVTKCVYSSFQSNPSALRLRFLAEVNHLEAVQEAEAQLDQMTMMRDVTRSKMDAHAMREYAKVKEGSLYSNIR